MHDLSAELNALPGDEATSAARTQALHLESRRVFSVRTEILVVMYLAVATLVAGVGLLIKANLDRIGPVALVAGILCASALCYAVALRAHRAERARSLGEDYVLLLGALLFSAAIGYAETQFRLFGDGWSRHLLWLAAWHLLTAYLLRSRLVLAVGLTAFAAWLGVEVRLGSVFDPFHHWFGFGYRALLCALLFWCGSWMHRSDATDAGRAFREVYLQFAANFAFWGALALGGADSTRLVGAMLLAVLAVVVGGFGLRERRESFLLYAVGYSTIGLVWLEALMFDDYLLTSWIGLFTVIGAVLLLLRLRRQLRESAP